VGHHQMGEEVRASRVEIDRAGVVGLSQPPHQGGGDEPHAEARFASGLRRNSRVGRSDVSPLYTSLQGGLALPVCLPILDGHIPQSRRPPYPGRQVGEDASPRLDVPGECGYSGKEVKPPIVESANDDQENARAPGYQGSATQFPIRLVGLSASRKCLRAEV
jgi:hypothetical protein